MDAAATDGLPRPAAEGVRCADLQLAEGQPLAIGKLVLLPLPTPGHTSGHHCYLLASAPPRLFTGEVLLIDGCGRTDLQSGDARMLYRSVHERLFTLPDDTLVYPGHGPRTTVGEEKTGNPFVTMNSARRSG